MQKAVGNEKELTIYQRGNGDWGETIDVVLNTGKSDPEEINSKPSTGLPKFNQAMFNDSGDRILLTTNSFIKSAAAIPGSPRFYTMKFDGTSKFRWESSSKQPADVRIDAAIFSNKEGTEITGCVTDKKTATCRLVAWDVDLGGSGRTLSRLDTRMRFMKMQLNGGNDGRSLLMAGQDRSLTLYDFGSRETKTYRGHSKPIDFCSFLISEDQFEPTLLSVVTGDNPEILKTELSKRIEENEDIALGKVKSTSAPVSFFTSNKSNQFLAGDDHGSVVLRNSDKDITTWQVAAWQNHVLSDDSLFAQNGNNQFLQYDRESGEIKQVLQSFAQSTDTSEKLNRFQVSRDGTIAIVEYENADELQVWDLPNQLIIKTLKYPTKQPTVALSPDGSYVVTGREGINVWSTLPGVDQPIFRRSGFSKDGKWPSQPISNVVFFDDDQGANKFAISWPETATLKGRLHLYSRQGQTVQEIARFPVSYTHLTLPTILRV